jgi:hypothetical protein
VQRDNLVADNVVAWRQFCWQHGGRGVVIFAQFVRDPVSRGDYSVLGEFGPAQFLWLQRRAIAFCIDSNQPNQSRS